MYDHRTAAGVAEMGLKMAAPAVADGPGRPRSRPSRRVARKRL